MLEEIYKELDELYTITGEDWSLSLHASLTEPTCPTASIHPDGWNISRYRVDTDSIEESLKTVVALVRAEIIDRRVVGSTCPYTNSDDGAFDKWLRERAAGNDAKLPDPPRQPLPKAFSFMVDSYLHENLQTILSDNKDTSFWAAYITASLAYDFPDRIDHDAGQKLVEEKLKNALPEETPQP